MAPEMSIPDVHTYDDIISRARDKAKAQAPRAGLVDLHDLSMLRAFARAADEGLIKPVVFCKKDAFEKITAEQHLSIKNVQVEESDHDDMAIVNAAKLAFEGELDLIVKGRVLTADMLGVLFDLGSYFSERGRTVSHVAVLQPERYSKLLMLTDSAVVVEPDLKAKLALIDNMIAAGKMFGIEMPRIAVLAAVEVVYPQMNVTMEAAVLAKMSERGQIKGGYVDGPLSFDVAVDMEAALSKGVTKSEVAGQADAMLAPNIEVANGIYKAMALYGKCRTGGVIIGGTVPIALGSRSDSEDGKFNSICLGVLAG
jgi:phosphate butyryltransferase